MPKFKHIYYYKVFCNLLSSGAFCCTAAKPRPSALIAVQRATTAGADTRSIYFCHVKVTISISILESLLFISQNHSRVFWEYRETSLE